MAHMALGQPLVLMLAPTLHQTAIMAGNHDSDSLCGVRNCTLHIHTRRGCT